MYVYVGCVCVNVQKEGMGGKEEGEVRGRGSWGQRALVAFTGPRLSSQHPQSSQQQPLTLVSGAPTPSLASKGTKHARGAQTHIQTKQPHIQQF